MSTKSVIVACRAQLVQYCALPLCSDGFIEVREVSTSTIESRHHWAWRNIAML